ncbi:XRE family transcriptional regulator [Lactococcus formosensis]|uniref:XRE family transcriptional regulator n=1 Tax=Lactococcus formosensis TaxID=1281486 RepID=A0A9X4P4R6_9LACT|nr:replication initiation factor domain-containing protein [Lactococcus formosensis]MDG6142448.1 XRE family transcriptional regulator [Lactococcus formosensis]MDG6159651.1 XRE family transcriptional regulator [Lactococcus formosensis]MDG6165885.1 XRE family transcriptional regulator [Lactococcus formosensis]MDG6172343.1 XRE family transcriptional regulator [Lactococcus formosensis]MDG6193106.1 XRE family transcriptional regulator [Lactococcus formosensis]
MNLKHIRQTQGLSQKMMAEYLGISKSYLAQLKNGSRPITDRLRQKIKAQMAENQAEKSALICTIDWVSLHFKTLAAADLVETILGLDLDQCYLEDYGRYRYPLYFRYGNINIYVDPKDKNQGVTIECSGMGCRELEVLLVSQGRDWYALFNDCLLYENQNLQEEGKSFNVTRLDLALDEIYSETGNYDLRAFQSRLEQGLVRTRKRSYQVLTGADLGTEEANHKGLTIYIGSRKSPLYFRFYQKDAERAKAEGISQADVHQIYGYKNRLELVLRKGQADSFVRAYVADYFDMSERAIQLINANIQVYADHEGHLDTDWYSLLGLKDSYSFRMQPRQVSLEKIWRWAEKAVLPTHALPKNHG